MKRLLKAALAAALLAAGGIAAAADVADGRPAIWAADTLGVDMASGLPEPGSPALALLALAFVGAYSAAGRRRS